MIAAHEYARQYRAARQQRGTYMAPTQNLQRQRHHLNRPKKSESPPRPDHRVPECAERPRERPGFRRVCGATPHTVAGRDGSAPGTLEAHALCLVQT
eukprot:1128234-Prymnesium_polylepis.1